MSAINAASKAGAVLRASPARKIEISFGMFEPAPGVNVMPGKRFSLVDGKLLSENGTFGKATYRTITVNTPQELSAALRGAPAGSFITQGVADVADLTHVVPTAQLEKNPGAITRTNAHIQEAEGGALVTVDYDPPEHPELAPAAMPLPREQITDIAGTVWMLDRPSTSAFVAVAATGKELRGERGRHINLAVAHGCDREEQLDRLHKRAILKGWYWPKITSQGSVAVATIVDPAMKRKVQPQFCAPILSEELVRGKTNGVLVTGGYLNIPPLTTAEDNECERRIAEMMKREDVVAKAAESAVKHAKALGARGISPESVKAAMEASALHGDVPLQLRLKGSSGVLRATVKDVLNDPEKYHEATALDPVAFIETAYSTNWCCKLYLLYQTSGPIIHSQAHGGRDFRLMNEARDDFAESAGSREKVEDAANMAKRFNIDIPPGVVGEIARYILASSRKPVTTFAVAGALTLASFLIQNQAYVGPSQTPLNLYHVLIGDTGRGKEDPRKAIKRMVELVAPECQSCLSENLSSGTALLRALVDNPALLLASDEYGIFMQAAMSDRGDPNRRDLVKELMTLYGLGQSIYCGKRYATERDNIPPILKPYVVVIGTTTPEELFNGMNMTAINNGSANRNIYVYAGQDVGITNRSPSFEIPDELAKKLRVIFNAFTNKVLTYGVGAEEAIAQFGDNLPTTGKFANLWSRAEENAIRVAGILAFCDGATITKRHVEWAIKYISCSIEMFSDEAERGISENLFEKQLNKALGYIRNAHNYRDDMQFSAFTKTGKMPRGKLLKLMKLPARMFEDVVKVLTETKQVFSEKIDGNEVYSSSR